MRIERRPDVRASAGAGLGGASSSRVRIRPARRSARWSVRSIGAICARLGGAFPVLAGRSDARVRCVTSRVQRTQDANRASSPMFAPARGWAACGVLVSRSHCLGRSSARWSVRSVGAVWHESALRDVASPACSGCESSVLADVRTSAGLGGVGRRHFAFAFALARPGGASRVAGDPRRGFAI
jgi:hypothetical protein